MVGTTSMTSAEPSGKLLPEVCMPHFLPDLMPVSFFLEKTAVVQIRSVFVQLFQAEHALFDARRAGGTSQ